MDKYIFFFSFLVLISSCKTSTVNNFDTEGMILIGGGSFKMGSDDFDSNIESSPYSKLNIASLEDAIQECIKQSKLIQEKF